nr:GDSL-type esterase/lipase family protein [Kineococcus siccus]
MGDSLAAGTGAPRPGDGLGPRLADGLAAGGAPTALRVLAVPGAVTRDLGPQVAAACAWPADVALLVVGGNDLVHGAPVEESVAHLERAVADLRAAGADVLVVPVPDLSVVVHVPPPLRPVVRAAAAALRAAQAAAVLRSGGRTVEPSAATTARFAAEPDLFSADRFHPSGAGYGVLAGELLPALAAVVRRRPGTTRAGPGD